jgi:hypothetical protein
VMEVEYFIPPGDDVWLPFHDKWMQESSVGLREDLMGWNVHEGDSIAHYARAWTDTGHPMYLFICYLLHQPLIITMVKPRINIFLTASSLSLSYLFRLC